MKNNLLGFCFLIFLASCSSSSSLQNKNIEDITDFDMLLQKVRMKYNMPAMAAAVIKSDEIMHAGVCGIRKIYNKNKLDTNQTKTLDKS